MGSNPNSPQDRWPPPPLSPWGGFLMPVDNPGLGVSNVLKRAKAYVTVHEGAGLVIKYD